MAGDWIKMRVWLARDPRTIAMADFLARADGFLAWLFGSVTVTHVARDSHVTRRVTVSVTVAGLLQVWGVTREQGRRDGEALVVPCARLSTLDEVAGVPSFGEAMASVGWAIERPAGEVELPNFFREQVSTADRLREQATERKRSQRARDGRDSRVTSHAACHADVTPMSRTEERRGEKREEKSQSPPTPRKRGAGVAQKERPEDVPLPEPLQGIGLEDWIAHRRMLRKPPTAIGLRRLISKLTDWGPERARAAIAHSLENGWAGVYEPDERMPRNGGHVGETLFEKRKREGMEQMNAWTETLA